MVNDQSWLEWGLALVTSGLAWVFKRHVARVDEIERTTVKKADFDQLADTVRSEVSAIYERMDRKFEEQTNRLFELLKDRR